MMAAKHKRVLILEDHAQMADLLAAILRREGCEVVVVSTLGLALEEARMEAFDLVLIDLYLEDHDAIATMSAAPQMLSSGAKRVVAITAREITPQIIAVASRSGIEDIVAKPTPDKRDEFIARLKALVANGGGK